MSEISFGYVFNELAKRAIIVAEDDIARGSFFWSAGS